MRMDAQLRAKAAPDGCFLPDTHSQQHTPASRQRLADREREKDAGRVGDTAGMTQDEIWNRVIVHELL